MHTYQYQPGDQPLEGYTIKSAAGHGGFGEVYYAVSDSGREVALKAVQGYEQIELRGIRQCMNLKNPHLVTIFDVKHNDKGQPFVLMEYVAGPSLRDLIDESPNGLSPEKTAFFLREIAKGLAYLHDCGIVHRDLKPANIFYEDGYVKIGDYGLSKAINADHHQSQTVTVGTVHYMAPEVGAGKYDRSIDIYAMGVVVYEMLTGHVPFKGASPSEVLMKHLSSNPELGAIEEPFREAITRAMAKDPAKRYQHVNEMVQTVFGEERMKQSMASFSQADLSMAAAAVGAKMRADGRRAGVDHVGGAVGVASDSGAGDKTTPFDHVTQRVQDRIDYASRRIDAKLTGRTPRPRRGALADPSRDTMTRTQRKVLAGVSLLVVGLGTGTLSGRDWDIAPWFAIQTMLGAVTGLALATKYILPGIRNEPGLIKRLAVGGTAIAFAGLFSTVIGFDQWSIREQLNWSLITLAVPLFFMDWSKVMLPGRAERLSFGSAIMAGLLGWITSWFVNDAGAILAIGIPAGVMLATQALSPFDPTTTEDWACGPQPEDDIPLPPPGQLHRHAHKPPAADHAPRQDRQHTERVNAYSAVVTDNVSTRSRLVALLVAVAPMVTGIPIFGIHRFYAGKVGTGILWLLTGGICGIGQIVDIILIACGAFNDIEGRPIKDWNPTERGRRAPAPHKTTSKSGSPVFTPSQRLLYGPGPFSVLLSMLASLMMMAGLVMGLALGLQLPDAIAADVFQNGLGEELNRFFGYDGWPALMHSMGYPLVIGLLIIAGILLTVARRHDGVGHMVRALLGAAGMGFAVLCSTEALRSWDAINRIWGPIADDLQANRIGPAIETFWNATQGAPAVFCLLSLGASIVILAWPPKRHDPAAPSSHSGEGV